MDAFHAIVLGVVQGLTEFLPVSSTGHIRIVSAFAGWDDPGSAFTAVIQLGTMAAVLVFFRDDLWNIARSWATELRAPASERSHEANMGWFLVIGTIPIAIVGFALKGPIEHGARDLYVIGSALVLFSFVMLYAERVAQRERTVEQIEARDGIAIGLAQVAALVPGVSRSGATISAGLFRGLEREAAARYSFLLSVPAVVLSGLFELRKVGESGGAAPVPTIIATVLAFIVGYASIAWLLRFVTHHSIGVFAGYRIAIGLLVIALAAAGAIS